MRNIYFYLLALVVFAGNSNINAQTDPDDIGYGENPGLVFWLRGDGNVTGSDPISAWGDLSGNGNNTDLVVGSPNQSVIGSVLNDQQVISFTGTDGLKLADNGRVNTYGSVEAGTERSMLIAFQTGANVSGTQCIYKQGGNGSGINVYIKDANLYVIIYTKNKGTIYEKALNRSVEINTEYVLSFVWNRGNLSGKLNGIDLDNVVDNDFATIASHTGNICIGYNDKNVRIANEINAIKIPIHFTGQIAELIYYDKALSSEEMNVLTNYLWTRYDVDFGSKYYSVRSGDPTDKSNWNTKKDESGDSPKDFTSNQIYCIQDGHTMSATNNKWEIVGEFVELNIANGGSLITDHEVSLPLLSKFKIDGTYAHNNNTSSIWNGTLRVGDASTINYGFGGDQDIEALAYANLTVASGGNKALKGETTVNGSLNLSGANVVLGTNDFIIADNATIEGDYTSTNMIVTGGDGKLIKEGDANTDFQMVYPVGTGSYYSPYTITSLACSGSGSVAVNAFSGQAPGPPPTETKDLQKYWEITQTGLTISSANVSFTYHDNGGDTEVGVGGEQSKYELISHSSGVWQVPVGASMAGINPMTLSSEEDIAGVWTAQEHRSVNVYYSYKPGKWSEWKTWTTDPSGTTLINADNRTPQLEKDQVVILDKVTMDVDKIECEVLNVKGSLDLGETKNHQFKYISGNGHILMAADNFPASTDCSAFTDVGRDEGTVVYYGSGLELKSERTFYNMEVKMDNVDAAVTLLSDCNINGNLTITKGRLQINNGSTARRTLSVTGDVNIAVEGRIDTGDGNVVPYHQFIIKGDFTNNGNAIFTHREVVNYGNDDTSGAVEVIFNNDTKNQMVLCNGTTVFNQITCDKGTDDTYILDISATNANNFKLFGRNNEAVTGTEGSLDGNKALRLLAGTLKLGSNIEIPSLSDGGSYVIDTDAKLWLYASANVEVGNSSLNLIAVYGTLQVSDNAVFTENTNSGLTLRSFGKLRVEGGTIALNGLRTSTGSSADANIAAYIQTGGTVNVNDNWGSFASFHLPFKGNVFHMSGGTLQINEAESFALLINSAEENTRVTGGTIIINMVKDFNNIINSRAPFWNLIVRNTNSTGRTLSIDKFVSTVTYTESMDALPLLVLNDLIIEGANGPTLKTNNTDISIGRNFRIEEGAIYDYGENTTIFNGTENGELYIGRRTINNGEDEQHFCNVTLNKPVGKSLTVTGDKEKEIEYQLAQTPRLPRYAANLMHVEQNLNLESGILNQGKHNIRLWGTTTVKKDAQCGVLGHEDALIMLKGGQINTENGAVFGNVKINPNYESPYNATVSFTSDVYIKRISYATGSINLGTYNLKVDELDNYEDNTPLTITDGNANKMFYTTGKSSDGGLSIKVTNGIYTFPIGSNEKYTPASATISDCPEDGGYLTIRPVDAELATANFAGGSILSYYWRVGHSGFADLPNVKYLFKYNEVGVSTNYLPGKVLDENPYTRSSEQASNFVTDAAGFASITFNSNNALGKGFKLEKANYTAGELNCFTGKVEVFYSVDHNEGDKHWGFWQNQSSWVRSDQLKDLDSNGTMDTYEYHDSRQDNNSGGFPGVGDVAIIGWVPWSDAGRVGLGGKPHCIWVRQPEECAEVIFTQMLDNAGNPAAKSYRNNYQFRPTLCMDGSQANPTLTTNLVRGEGSIWVRFNTDPDFTTMDLGEFAKEDSSYVMYENNMGLDINGKVRTYNNSPTEFPNLIVSNDGWGQSNHSVTFSKDIKTNGNLEIMGNANLLLPTGGAGNISVGKDLVMYETTNTALGSLSGGGAELVYQNTGTVRTVTVGRDVLLNNSNNHIYVKSSDGSAVDHELHVGGNIFQTSTTNADEGLDLCDDPGNDRITLFMDGTNNATIDIKNGNVPDLYRLVVNKGTDQSAKVTVLSNFTLQGETHETLKAIDLQYGTLIFDNPLININLTTGDDNFKIPSTTSLEVKQGTVKASGGSGIALDGLLRVSGGTVNMEGGDNPIVYSTSGNAELQIISGTLSTSQIRRDKSSTEGILKYYQEGGFLNLGKDAAGVADRGIFEILNGGSSFTHKGGIINIINDRRVSPSVASLYFSPSVVSMETGTVFNFGGLGTDDAVNEFSIYAGNAVSNVNITNGSTLTANTVPLTINEKLTIVTGCEFDANALDLILKGDFENNGVFKPSDNKTYFSGAKDQQIFGEATFYNLYKNTPNVLNLAADITVNNNLYLKDGVLNDKGNSLFAKGDMYLDIEMHTDVDADVDGKGLVACGTTRKQNLYGSPQLAVLKMDNADGVYMPNSDVLTVNNALLMKQGILDIGDNLLVIGKNADITTPTVFSSTNMIQTNRSFTDAGIKKYFSVINSSTSFVYPIGSEGKYTPVILDISSINEDASLRIKAANEHQITVQNGLGTLDTNNEVDNVLQYYWILDADGITSTNATVVMQAYKEHEKVVEPNKIENYIVARLRSRASGVWEKYSENIQYNYNENNFQLTFTLLGGDVDIDGDYTAGIEQAIPDKVAEYVSQGIGNWSTPETWLPNAPVGGPRGAIVVVNHEVTMDQNSENAYELRINKTGKIKVNQTFGHRLGYVLGEGTLYMERGDLPAGDYEDFFAVNRGKVVFGYTGVLDGSENYDILNKNTTINDLEVCGSGVRRLPNAELQLLGGLIIDGPILTNVFSQKLNIKKDLEFKNGTYTSSVGDNCIVNFNGTTLQTIKGSKGFVATNAFNNFEINNSAGLKLENDVEINGKLKFGSGIIYSSNGHTINITNTATECVSGYSSSNYISGPLSKAISKGDKFGFPVGDGGRYGNVIVTKVSQTGTWEAQYYNSSPSGDYDVSSMVDPVKYVSHNEYWRVKAPESGQTANLTLRWDGASGVSADENFSVVKWTDLSTDAWENLNIANKGTSSSGGSVELMNDLSFGFSGSNHNHYITFGSISIPAFSWLGNSNDWFTASNWSNSAIPNAASNVTVSAVAADKFYPIIDPAVNPNVVQVNDLLIESGSKLTLEAGTKMTVNGDMTTNSGLHINNVPTKPTSFITYGAVTGETNVSWPLTDRKWWYIGHSVTGITEDDYIKTIGKDLYAINAYDKKWNRVSGMGDSDGLEYSFDNPLEGYSIIIKDPGQTLAYNGDLNNNEVYAETYDAGVHLVANPYPSYIDVEKAGFALTDIEPTVYIRKSNNAISTYNILTNEALLEGSRYVAPGQCMWLSAKNNSAKFSIAKSTRTHTTGSYGLKSASLKPNDRLRLSLQSDYGRDESVVIFNEEGADFYTEYDSEKIMNKGNLVNLFSLKEGKNIAINSLPEIENNDVVPLGYSVSDKGLSEFTLRITNMNDFNRDVDVYLKDKVTGDVVNLRETPEYTFTPAVVSSNDRFEINFEMLTTGINTNNTELSKKNVLIYAVKKQATVKVAVDLLKGKERLIQVFNLAGQLVSHHDLFSSETTFNLPKSNSMYIVKVSIDSQSYQEKVISLD